MNQTMYIISGQVCSGKTTFSRKLSESTGALRFTPDEIIQKIYPFKINKENFDFYFYKCCQMEMIGAEESLRQGFDIILDFGFWKKSDRELYKALAKKYQVESKLFYVKCDIKEIRSRLILRNRNLNDNTFLITEEEFNFFSPGFEEPDNSEIFEIYDNN